METTERIVEAYVRYIKNMATISNIRCKEQYEIDLIAIDPSSGEKYHIESGVSISAGFSRLTDKPYSDQDLKKRLLKSGQRRTIGYFIERKFGNENVLNKLKEYGFRPGEYNKIIVSWGWDDAAKKRAECEGIVLWDFRDLLREITEAFTDDRTYFTDDTLRTLHLFAHANKYFKQNE